MKLSKQFEQRAGVVRGFRDDFVSLLEVSDEVRVGVARSKFVPKEGKEVEHGIRFRKAAASAGRAAEVAHDLGKWLVVDIPGKGRTQLQTIHSWQYALDQPWIVDPTFYLGEVEAIIGHLEQKATDLRNKERSFVGRVAAFVGLPAAIRAAVAESHPSLGKAGFGAGVLAQMFVTVVGGALAVGLVAGVVALWGLVM
jgi:hypothetical protein